MACTEPTPVDAWELHIQTEVTDNEQPKEE